MTSRAKGSQALARKDRKQWLTVAATSAILIGILSLYALTH